MALEQLCGPAFPIAEQPTQVLAAVVEVPAEQARGRGRRAGASVEHRNAHLAAGERLRDQRHVTNDTGQEGEAQPAFEGCQGAAERRPRRYVSETECEEGR